MSNHSVNQEELKSSIGKTRRQVTILFTDIVDSSRYWDQFGDIQGRMMVDRHNRLVFPVIRKFHGRVVKTIGDGLMAVFKRPNDALNAAIGIQQILKRMRDADRSFHAKVRIGIHTGSAIVEQKDVFGDAVNVAKRVESFGHANEIYLSEATAEFVSEKKHAFHKKGSFIPKGKREPMTVYRCRWNEYKDLARALKISSNYPLDSREKGDLVAYSIITFAVFALLFMTYLRYLAVDALNGDYKAQLLIMNPALTITEKPSLLLLLIALLLAMVLLLIWLRTIPYIVLRLLKGIAGFGLGFVLIYAPALWFNWAFAGEPGQEIVKSEKQFIQAEYRPLAPVVEGYLTHRSLYEAFDWSMVIPAGPADVDTRFRRTAYAPVPQAAPVRGIWNAGQLSPRQPRPFVFRLLDLCALALGVMGFVSGYMNFAISPR